MIRIIGGAFKGRRLKMLRSPLVRPMSSKLREALFNILGERVRGAVALDGFAGTGSVGLEAISRGASLVVFVDEFYPAVKTIHENLVKCQAEERARIIHQEFNRAVIRLAKEKAGFDLIFLDPPYKLLEERHPLKVVKKRGILNPEGLIVLRRFRKTPLDGTFFELCREVTLGDDTLSFFR